MGLFTSRNHQCSRSIRNRCPSAKPAVEPLEDRCLPSANIVFEWTDLLLNVSANQGNQVTSRAMAMMAAAVYDAVNAIDRSYTPYIPPGAEGLADIHASRGASKEAAAAQAAHDILVDLYPSQKATFDMTLAEDLVGIPRGRARQGIKIGRAVAEQILAWRAHDGSTAMGSYTHRFEPGQWRPTPPNPPDSTTITPVVPQWPDVTPFAMTSGDQFRPGPPPVLTSAEYTTAFNEVRVVGAVDAETADRDGNGQPDRTPEQTNIARFWGVGPANGAVAVWNQIAETAATAHGFTLVENARLFALLNVAVADAYIAGFDVKYAYNFWRPVTAIRAADTDGNPDTSADPNWLPLLTTPNHQSYVALAESAGKAASQVLAFVFGDDFHFTVANATIGMEREYSSFSEASQEAGVSRIYAGIHFSFDVAAGGQMASQLGSYVAGNFFLPVTTSVESVGLNDGAAQRSMVQSLTVTFSGLVTIDAGAFELRRQDGSLVDLSVAASVVDGQTVAVLTFSGADIIGSSLADGDYTLTTRGDRIHDSSGQALDGDGDGRAGGNRLDSFFRLYGDSDGDRDVDRDDLGRFLAAFGALQGSPRYVDYLDYNGDERIWLADLEAFLDRLGSQLDP
jgi:hypothetical protein